MCGGHCDTASDTHTHANCDTDCGIHGHPDRDPDRHTHGHPDRHPDRDPDRHANGEELPLDVRRTRLVDLPVSATEDRVVGTLDIEKAIQRGERHFEAGVLASANRGILYVDEVNLLDDHVVDLLLDSAAMGVNVVEREGISFTHPARFILVGTMNPEEGDLRPQLLDRFALAVDVRGLHDVLSVGLVESGLHRSRGDRPGTPVHLRRPRRGVGGAPGGPWAKGRRMAVPHGFQLHPCLPQGDPDHQGDRRGQEGDRSRPLLGYLRHPM